MFTTKPTALALTLVFYIALALVLTTGSDAKGYAPVPVHRNHVSLNRLIKKRAPSAQGGIGGLFGGGNGNADAANAGAANGAGADPPTTTATDTGTSSASSTAASSTPTPSNTPAPSTNAPASSNTPAASTSQQSSSSTNDPLGVSTPLSSTTQTSSTSSTSSSSTTSSLSPSTSLSTASLPSITGITASPIVSTPSSTQVTVTTQASDASASSSPTASSSESASKITRATLTVLVVIAACVGGTAIIWTVIRKWKLRTSSQFDERMRPIDWQPTTSEDGIPGHNRAGSSASSFHSGSGHDGLGGYGATIDHGRSPSPLPPIPDHDFTAGPTTLAPVGGYADLARGPSPQPQMQEALTRGPSLTRPQYDQYGVPLHHQGGYGPQDPYDYNGGRY